MTAGLFQSLRKIDLLRQIAQDQAAILARLTSIEAALAKGFTRMSGAQNNFQSQLDQLTQAATNETNLDQAIITVLNGNTAMLQKALQDAQNNGVSADQLASFQAALTVMQNNAATAAAAITANTVADPNAGGALTGGAAAGGAAGGASTWRPLRVERGRRRSRVSRTTGAVDPKSGADERLT